MLFNSIPFFILFIVTYIFYWNSADRYKKYILIFSSVLFYAWFNLWFLFHFLGAIAVNYYLSGLLLDYKNSGRDTSSLVKITIALNFINLAVFKYFYFFTDLAWRFTGMEEVREFASSVNIFLPLAISFYTFQLTALQIDIHRGVVKERISPADYFLFILFFPQLIAGPIMRTGHFLSQIDNPSITRESMNRGLYLIMGGLLKKVVIADTVSGIIAPVFSQPNAYDSYSLLVASFGFVCQVYADFSGYTDMARGLALLLGFTIPENFRGPFLSRSFTEFWSTWHITLSTWLRDYLYIPLGGNRGGFARANFNMLVTMTLGGLWHGATLGYVFWGAFLGLVLWLERFLSRFVNPGNSPVATFLKTVTVFFIFSLSGIFFRTASMGEKSSQILLEYFYGLFSFQNGEKMFRLDELLAFIILTLVFNLLQRVSLERFRNYDKYLIPVFSIIMLLIMGAFGDGGSDFVYFQF